jgi:mono/diheme cytochrome c family protein
MRFYVISTLVFIPLLALLSLVRPLVTGVVEKPIGPEIIVRETGFGDAARGEALYSSRCYGCHVPEANVGPAHNSVDFKVRYADDEAIAIVVRAGRQPMPAFTEQMLSDQELADIIAYLQSLPPP